uniref:Ig-like domain-containing protein n=1 Tax=Amphiprion percula TaxID=161767 RepID=A0A3P8TF90_AMPPE
MVYLSLFYLLFIFNAWTSDLLHHSCTGQSMESIPSSSVVKRPGETLSLSCRGSGFTFTCCSMHWIRQPAGKTLEWLGRGYSNPSSNTYSSSVQGRIEISRDDSNSMVYLRLSNLQPEDSAVYYCAKDTQWFKSSERLTQDLGLFSPTFQIHMCCCCLATEAPSTVLHWAENMEDSRSLCY